MGDAFTTIVTGTTVLVVGQAAIKVIIEPVQEMRRLIGRISHALIYDANVLAGPRGLLAAQRDEVVGRFRNLAAELEQQMHLVPLYPYVARAFRLPSPEAVRSAGSDLILLSDRLMLDRGRTAQDVATYLRHRAADALGIFVDDKDRVTKEVYDTQLDFESPRPWPESK